MAAGNTLGSSSASEQSDTVTLVDGQSIIVYTDIDLAGLETVIVERTYDAGSNYRPAGGGETLLDANHREARLTGPGGFKFTKSITDVATQMYYDS